MYQVSGGPYLASLRTDNVVDMTIIVNVLLDFFRKCVNFCIVKLHILRCSCLLSLFLLFVRSLEGRASFARTSFFGVIGYVGGRPMELWERIAIQMSLATVSDMLDKLSNGPICIICLGGCKPLRALSVIQRKGRTLLVNANTVGT